jgi:Rer1 family protein
MFATNAKTSVRKKTWPGTSGTPITTCALNFYHPTFITPQKISRFHLNSSTSRSIQQLNLFAPPPVSASPPVSATSTTFPAMDSTEPSDSPFAAVSEQTSRLGQMFQSYLDKSTPYVPQRWAATGTLFALFFVRIFWAQGWYIGMSQADNVSSIRNR